MPGGVRVILVLLKPLDQRDGSLWGQLEARTVVGELGNGGRRRGHSEAAQWRVRHCIPIAEGHGRQAGRMVARHGRVVLRRRVHRPGEHCMRWRRVGATGEVVNGVLQGDAIIGGLRGELLVRESVLREVGAGGGTAAAAGAVVAVLR